MKPSFGNSLLRNFVLATCICLTLGQAAHAGSIYWDTNGTVASSGAATGTWGISAFWTTTEAGTATPNGTLPTANDDVFIAAGTAGTTGTITIDAARVAGSVSIQEPAANPGVTISGGTSLTLGGGSSVTKGLFVTGNGTHTVSTPVLLNGANTIQNAGTGTLTVNGGVSGTGNLTLNNNSSSATGIQILASQVNITGAISNTGSSSGTAIIGNAVSTTGTGGLSATITSVSQNSPTSPLQFLNANNSAYAGNYDINAGTLNWAGTNTGPGVGTNLGTITATNAASVINLGATSGTAAATMNIVNNAVSGKVNNNILVRAGSTGTKTIGVAIGGNGVTFTTTGTITLDDNVTLNPSTGGTTTLVTLNPNGLISNGANGAKGITKAGAGTVNFSLAHNYTGATSVTAGILALTGLNGSLPGTSGITVSGGTLQLNNTAAANNTNRIPDSTPISINGGTLNFSHTAGAASYSETLTVTAASSGTISTSQAALGQTSILTIGTFTRSPGSALAFSGTGLGVDATNRILFTSPPTTLSGVLPWATYGGTGFASYDGTNGIIATTTTDIDAQGSTIVDNSTSNLRIFADGTGAPIALGATTTSINTLVQANTAITTPTIDTASKTLQVNGVLLSSATNTKGLTIGTATDSGTLTAGTAGGELLLINNSASALTLNAVIANNTSATSVTKAGTGDATFAGNNTYSGPTILGGGVVTATHANAFGSGTVTLQTPTRRLVVANGVTITNPITFAGGGEALLGAFQNSAAEGNATIAGPITISGNLAGGGHFASTGTNGTLTISGSITATTTSPVVRAGVVIFNGVGTASNYATFNASAGVTRLGASDALLPTATLDMGNSADSRFDLNGFNQTLAGITRSGNSTFIGNASLTGNSTLTTTGTSTYSGSILNVLSPGTQKTFLVVNSGSLTLTGAFSAETATINNTGTLNINVSAGDGFAPAARLITVNNGGTLMFGGANKVHNDTVIDVKSGGIFDQNGQTDVVGYLSGGGSITNLNGALIMNMPLLGSGSDFSGSMTGTAALSFTAAGTGASASSTQILSGANDVNGVSVSGGRLIGRNAAAFGVAGKIVTVGASALTLDPTVEFGNDTPMNSHVLNIGSGNTGTFELNRATAGAALVQPASASTLGNGTLNIEKGANVTSGTPTLEFASIALSAGATGLGAATLNPVDANISVLGDITRPGASASNLRLDGNSTGNVIAGAMQDNGANKLNVTKQNSSTWTLVGINNYSGTTTISGGTLALGAAGSIANTSAIGIAAGAKLETVLQATYAMPAAKTVTFDINSAGAGSSGQINAAGLDISAGVVAFNVIGTLDDAAYVLATYTSKTGAAFASVTAPSGYTIDYAYNGGTQIALVQSASPYDTWGAPYGLATGSEGGDLDNDGLTNQQEFAFGLIPNNGSSGNPIIVQLDKTTGQFTYQRLTASGLTYTIWTSPDLATWTLDAGATQAPATVGANQSVLVTLSGTKPLTATKLFVRVNAN